MELQKKSIDALLESVAILRQELQNNQDSEKEIELLGELKLLSAKIYIESDLTVMLMMPEMSEDISDSLDEVLVYSDDIEDESDAIEDESDAIEVQSDELQTEAALAILELDFGDSDSVETEKVYLEGEQLEEDLTDNAIVLDLEVEHADGLVFIEEMKAESDNVFGDSVLTDFSGQLNNEEVTDSVISPSEEVAVSNDEESLQQDLFFAAVPVLGGQKNSNSIQEELAKNANEEDSVAKIANIDFNSPEFELPDFELPDFELPVVDASVSEGSSIDPTPADVIPKVEFVSPPIEVESPSDEFVSPAEEVIAPPVEFVSPTVEVVESVAEVVIPPVEVAPPSVEVVPPAVEVVSSPISAINTITESTLDSSSSVQLNENGELPPPALSGMNVEAIVNQMPISRRFEFANLLFGGDIQRMGTFIHELLQAPSGSGRMDVYERWYDENNWRRRDEAASDMLRLIKRIFPG